MYDPLKNDVAVTIARLECVHGELRTRYERAKADYEYAEKEYKKARLALTEAQNDFTLADRALSALDDLRDGTNHFEDDEDYF